MKTTCTITVEMQDLHDVYDQETVVKNLWPHFTAFLTRRHGVDEGDIILRTRGELPVKVTWKYEDEYPEESF